MWITGWIAEGTYRILWEQGMYKIYCSSVISQPYLTISSFETPWNIKNSKKINHVTQKAKTPHEPSLLWANQSQLSQPLLTWEILQSLNYSCGCLLDLPYHLHNSLVQSPELHTHPRRASPVLRGRMSPQPAGNTLPNAAQVVAKT